MVVFNGYDHHSLILSGRILARIQAGKPVTIHGQGFPVEGFLERDFWSFNSGALGAVHVFTDEGREVFEGDLGEAEVLVLPPRSGQPRHPLRRIE